MKFHTVEAAYERMIKSVLRSSLKSIPRGIGVRELYNVGFCLENAKQAIIRNPARKLNMAYAAIEMLGLFRRGIENVEPYLYYNPKMSQYLNRETGTWDGSYAERLMLYRQMPKMLEILSQDPDSRRAVISFYNPAHDFHEGDCLDICCTLSLIFRLREGKLHLTCTMRSNDVILGLPYDLTQFTFLQSVLACWLGVEVGSYYHFTANMHLYEHDETWAQEILCSKWEDAPPWKNMPKWDIANPKETFDQIRAFFSAEKQVRMGKWSKKQDVLGVFSAAGVSSAALLYLIEVVFMPFWIKKALLLQK